jgi:glycosyltransferase involved in cell wall biosynthesis
MTSKRIRVCHLIPSFWTGHGPSSGILAQVRAHETRDFAFSVWSLYPPPPALDPQNLLREAGLDYRVFPMGPSFLDVRVLWPLVLQLRAERPDILHCHLVRANLYGRIAARLAGVKGVICSIRGIDGYVTSPDLIPRALRLVERLTACWVAKYAAVSETARLAIIKHLQISPEKIVTILNAVDLAPFQARRGNGASLRAAWELPPEAVVVGSVGRLGPLKNYANLIRWVGELTAAFPKVHLLLIGDGEERLALEALIKELHLGDRVRLLGHREDIPEMLGTMDIFAFPSLSEGLPRAVMEAMAAGLPCVVMDVGGNAEAVVDGHTGYVVPPGDGPGFKAALTRLLRDGELRKKLGAAGKKRAFTLFNPKRLAAEYEALYRSVLNRNQGH